MRNFRTKSPLCSKDVRHRIPAFAGITAAAIIRGYQLLLSPFLGRNCRFLPTCSCYAREAMLSHGVLKGGWLACKRICRCHPLGGQGVDPVPPRAGDV